MEANDTTKPPASDREYVWQYLQAGRTLTNKVALTCLNVGSLSSRIAELRKEGKEIIGTWASGRDGRRYIKYRLPGAKEEDVE